MANNHSAMDFQSVILNRRNGKGNTKLELQALAQGAARATTPDYELAAWLMAEYFQPLSAEETAWLTLAMADSGERLDLSGLPKPWVDKHSTGGVGDKTSIVLLPLLACCGITIVKMSGRGLGITGGTVDKLESVPGFRMDLTPDELKSQAKEIGIAITGQTADLAPADKVLYALRDVTGTVDSIPLIVSSILSKKIAGGAEQIVLDVKAGSGGFMPNLSAAQQLANALKVTGDKVGLPTHIAITDMDQPLGRMVGNILEVKEAAATLNGESGRFADLCIDLAAHALVAIGKASDPDAALTTVRAKLASGEAKERARTWFKAQGAKVDVFEDLNSLPTAPISRPVLNRDKGGFVHRVDARIVGETVVDLGGGRRTKADQIDPRVGVECLKHVGDEISPGEPVFIVHASSSEGAQEAERRLLESVRFAPDRPAATPLILETM